jgi:two-component system sensor histidine kinase ChiS
MGIIKLSIYRLQKINEAYGKYLPGSFLKMLDKRRIIDFKLGDMAEKEMTIMFSDIRSYTNLSESMSPHDNFRFLVKYLKQIGEMLNKNKGFPVQYYGDGVMAMFHGKTDYPVHAALDMHKQVALYSADRVKKGRRPINIGVGLHTGNVIMGIRGDDWRWEGGIVGDSVNIASRIEGLTKMFGASTILTEDVFTRLEKPAQFHFRYLGKVQVKGKDKPLKIYELLDAENPETFSSKMKILDAFNEAVHCFLNNDWNKALALFREVMSEYDDKATAYYISIIQEAGAENAAATNKTIVINSK